MIILLGCNMNVTQITKAVGLTGLMLASTAASAGWQGNFLIGAEGGYAWRDGHLNQRIVDYSNAGALRFILSTQDNSLSFADSAGFGGLLVGYQAQCNRLLLGLEANFDWHGTEDNKPFHHLAGTNPEILPVEHHFATASYERGFTVGLSARAGYEVTRWLMPYIRLGIETSRDTLRYNSELLTPGIAALPVQVYAQGEERSYRFVGGAGLEFDTYIDELTFRVEYNYVPNSKRVKASAGTVDTAVLAFSPIQEHFVDTKQDQHVAKAALVYNFY